MNLVTENLWRGARPKDLRALIAQGFKRVVDFQSGAEDCLTDSLYEAQTRAKRIDPTLYPEIEVIYIPCSDVCPPTNKAVQQFLKLMADPIKTYVHCHSGVDRTGFMVAVFRMVVQKWDFARAKDEWSQMGRHVWYFWWSPFLRKWETK